MTPTPPTPPAQPEPPEPPEHTDACIINAARYGFCDHTRLFADPSVVRSHDLVVFIQHRSREYAAWLGFVFLIIGEVVLFMNTPLFPALAVTVCLASAWSALFSAGLPSQLVADPLRELPLDVQQRLAVIPPFRPRPRSR